jgi:putative solute:sodium symporter small subunit
MSFSSSSDRMRRHWRAQRALTWWLLLPWLLVSFGVTYFARELDALFMGWPVGFWVAAQGAPLVYLVIVWAYAAAMDRIDARYASGSADGG